jgi:hypothetical protein
MRHLAASDLGACAREASHGHGPATKGTKAIEHNASPNVVVDCLGVADRALRASILQRSTSGDVEEAPRPAP